jgi:hypothetical protein
MKLQRSLYGKKALFIALLVILSKIVQGQAKRFCSGFKFLAHRGMTHQSVVRIQGDAEFLLIRILNGCSAKLGVAPVWTC